MSDASREIVPAGLTSEKVYRSVRNSLVPHISSVPTYIILVAVSRDGSGNFVNKLNCKNGIPIGGYIYDAQNDCYFYECADFLHLGTIPISLRLTLDGDLGWDTAMPVPPKSVVKMLNPSQRKSYTNFKRHFKASEYIVSFVQMIHPN